MTSAGACPPVAVVMGSNSDWATMRHAVTVLDELGVASEARIVSAHRTPERLYAFARSAREAGFKVIVATRAEAPWSSTPSSPVEAAASGSAFIRSYAASRNAASPQEGSRTRSDPLRTAQRAT